MSDRSPVLIYQQLVTRLEEKPEALALVFENGGLYPDEKLTYTDLVSNTCKFALGLRHSGIGKGDVVALVLRNQPEVVYAMAAANLLGMVVVPIDPRSKGEKLTYMLENSQAKAVITTPDLLAEVETVSRPIGRIERIWLSLKPDADSSLAEKYPTINELLAAPDVFDIDDSVDDPSLPMEIIYTSGVTGNPKGVVVKASRTAMYTALATMVWGYAQDSILYTGLSLTHGNAQAVTLMGAMAIGIPAVISQRFTKSRIWDICRAYGCTSFSLLGGMMSGIYNEPPKPYDADNPVKVVISAGTPLAIWEAFEKRFNVKILEWYGAIEGGFAYKPIGEGPIGSFGKPLEGLMEAVVVDEKDDEVPLGVTGELLMRAVSAKPEVEYYGKPKDSEEKTRGGWLRTGDMVHKDQEGWLFFDYRKEGGGLRRAGDFIIPSYVEKVLGEHPDVSEVCVYGVPAASGAPGESDLVAALAPFPGKGLQPDEIFALAVKGLERNSVPSYLQIVEEIPKSSSEKYLDRLLRDDFAPEAENVYRLEDYEV